MAKKLRYSGQIPRVPIGADTSQADKEIDKLFQRVEGLKHIEVDVDVSHAQRRLETIIKRTNSQMNNEIVNMMLKDVKTVLGAMKTEFEKVGTTDIYRSLEKTCDMVEDRFSNLNISIDKKQIAGLTNILNAVDEMQSISSFSFGEIVSSKAVQNSEKVLSNIKTTKKEITAITGKADYIIKTLNKSSDKAFSTEKLQEYQNKLHELRGQLKGFYEIDDELIQNSLLNAAAKINEALGQIDVQLPKSKSTADILSVGETVKGLDKVKREVKEASEMYESFTDIITKSRNAILGSDFGDNLFNKDSVEGYAESLTKVRDKMAEIREEAYAAKVDYEATLVAIDTYTGRKLGNKTAFQNAIKDAWKTGEHQAAAKLFEQYQARFTDGKFNPAKQFGAEWSKNFVKNLEEANRSLSIWRAGLKNSAEEYGKWMAFTTLQEKEGLLQSGYEEALRARAATEQEAAKSAATLSQAQRRFATNDLTVAQNNLNAAIDEYNSKLAESNRLLTEKRRLEDLDSFENEPWYKETELPANHIMAIAQQFADAENAVEQFKITLKEAVRVYRELGGDMKLPFSDEGLVKEIDVPVKAVAATKTSKYYEIDESAARRAKEANSFSDYIPGSATKAYRQAVDELSAIVESKKKQFPDRAEELDRMLDAYAKRYAEYINKQNAIDASVPSVLVAGPAGLKQSQKDKQNQRREANYKFFQEKVEALENKIKDVGTGTQAIRTDDNNALEDLERKVEELKKAHQVMVEANKYFRKHKTLDGFDKLSDDMKKEVEQTRAAWGQPDMQPFPQYVLQNSNQEIKRLEGRVKELSGLKNSEGLKEVNDFYSLVTDKQDMRIRISFEMGKPEQEIIDMLKGKAFKWSPKNEAWQRQLTANAVRDTKDLQKSLHEYFNITSEPSPQITEAQTKMAETIKLIGELQTKYGTEKFGAIFGDIGAIDVSNAEAVYDLLIAKEKEYLDMLTSRTNAVGDFATLNNNLLGQFVNTDNYGALEVKFGELAAGILEGGLSLEEANEQLQKFVGTFNKIEEVVKTNDNITSSNKELAESFTETADAIKQQGEAVSEYYKSLLPDNTIKQLTKGVDINGLFKEFNIPVNDRPAIQAEFNQLIDVLHDLIVNGNDSVETYDLQKNKQSIIEDMIVKLGSVKQDRIKLYEDFYNYMQNMQIGYTDADKAEFGDDWTNIIRKFGAGRNKILTKDSGAMRADQVYQELLDLFPALFDSDIINEKDQLKKILDVAQRARDEHKNKSKSESSDLTNDAINYVHEVVNNSVNAISTNALKISDEIQQAVEQERLLREAALDAGNAIEGQAGAAKKVTNVLSGANVSVEELIARDVNKALEQLRSAQNNETTLFSLKGVFEGEDLVVQAQEMVQNIAKQSNLSVGKFVVKDDVIKVQLYNEELKVTVDQMYRLRAATEDMESAQLELFSQSFSQNVKALNENNFDVEGVQQRAFAAIEKVRSSLHGLEYDLTDLEKAAKNISSQDDFTKFNNQIKAAQDNIQAIKNSTVSKSSMNPLANMQRDMQNANIEIETMRLKLEKFGDIQGVAEAKKMLADMAEAAKQYTNATNAQGQQNAYNQYSNLRSSFKAQTEYINAAKALNDSQKSEEKKTDPIREQYQFILDLINKINAKSAEITKYQAKDSGSGMFASYIQQLQAEKSKLVSELSGITNEINNTLSGGFIQGKEFSVPFASFLDGSGAISSFLNDTRTQASLTTEEIERLVTALQKSQNIDAQAATRVAEQFKSTQETFNRLSNLTELDASNANYQALVGMFNQIMQYKDQLSSDSTSWTPEESAHLQALIEQFTKYGNALADVAEKEARYFAGKQKYSKEKTNIGTQEETKQAKELLETRQKLEEAARGIAERESLGDPMFTKFTQGADGIAKLDFSAIEQATGTLRTFHVEMGSVTKGIYEGETTITRAMANIKAAENQLASMSDLIGRANLLGVDTKGGSNIPQVQNLLDKYQALAKAMSSDGKADNSVISQLVKESKMASAEVEKLLKNMSQMESAIASGQAKGLGNINPNGDIYGQLVGKAQELASAHSNAALQLGRFDATTNTLNASLVHANGTVEQFKVSMYGLSGECAAQQAGVGKLTTSWDIFKTTMMGAGKHLMTALVGYNVFFKAISEVRKGIGYVKEIDLALTELKKVTNETEASYRKFLDTAADSAGEIGSTVSAFTEATANFARLGYSMSESAEMAKTAIVYKNVADGLDTVDEATDSIISTMKAFGIESDNTMQIIDVFNEVGKYIAQTI